MNRILLHVLTVEEDATRPRDGAWTPPGFTRDGFVHLCTPTQLLGVVKRHYPGRDVVVLALSEGALHPPVRDEDLYGHGAFPHLYGPLPSGAVVEQARLEPGDPDLSVPRVLASLRCLRG